MVIVIKRIVWEYRTLKQNLIFIFFSLHSFSYLSARILNQWAYFSPTFSPFDSFSNLYHPTFSSFFHPPAPFLLIYYEQKAFSGTQNSDRDLDRFPHHLILVSRCLLPWNPLPNQVHLPPTIFILQYFRCFKCCVPG